MALNESKGNMYEWITHTWNAIKGECPHDCSYCYMKRWGKLNPARLDEKEMNTNLGSGNNIFVGSSCDMFAQNIPEDWIKKTLEHCAKFENNHYLFQTKNPENIRRILAHQSSVCVTLESNRFYKDIMQNSPEPIKRFEQMMLIRHPLYVTIEPIMEFDLEILVDMMYQAGPEQINIGADSGNNNLPEPPKEKILELITELEKFTKVKQKSNLKRLL
jgi:DNA repair photolyase